MWLILYLTVAATGSATNAVTGAVEDSEGNTDCLVSFKDSHCKLAIYI